MNSFFSKYCFYYPSTLLRGEFVSHHLAHYRKFQTLSGNEIRNYQRRRVYDLIKHASKHSEFYRSYAFRSKCSRSNFDDVFEKLHTFPLLTKQDIITHNNDIQTYYRRWSSKKTTGGSTGEPVVITKNPAALARERAATWRAYEWAGVQIGDKQARFWGMPHRRSDKIKAKFIDYVANRHRVSAFNLTESYLAEYYRSLQKYKPHYLYGYVSVIETFAEYLRANKHAPLPSLKAIITTSEVLTDSSRKAIQDTFGTRVFNEYGCGEVGSIAHECEFGSMHIMADNLYLEIDGGGSSGEIVVTDFFNFATPLIRYKIGDFATLDNNTCACGRTLPTLKGIHGRAYDVIHTSDGRSLHPEAVMYVFEDIQKKNNAFKHFQVIQEDINHFRVNIVPSANWSEATKMELQKDLMRFISPQLKIQFYLVDNILREKSGKMRVIKSRLGRGNQA